MQRTNAVSQRQWRNRPVLREIDERRVRRLWHAVLAIAMAVTPWAVYLLQQNERLTVVYEVEELKSELVRLQKEERQLKMQRAEWEALSRIEDRAKKKHGMVRPDPGCVFMVSDAEQQSEKPTPPAPSGSGKTAH